MTESEQLTPEGHAALKVELAKRRIDNTKPLTLAEEAQQGKIVRPGIGRTLVFTDLHSVGGFLAEVYRVYHDHFWLYVKLTVPSVIVGWIAVYAGGYAVREILRGLPRGLEMLGHQTEVFEIGLINLARFLVSWLAVAFSFGAICIAIRQVTGGTVPSVPGGIAEVRERAGPFMRLSLVLFISLVVEFAVATGLIGTLVGLGLHFSRFGILLLSYCLMGALLLVFSRFALAIPAVVLDNCRIGQALFRSDELTQGQWLTLAALLGKSLLGGYLAGMCPFWLAYWIRGIMVLPSWFSWILSAASIAAVTVVEATMFIGFALLYLETSALSPLSNKPVAHQLA